MDVAYSDATHMAGSEQSGISEVVDPRETSGVMAWGLAEGTARSRHGLFYKWKGICLTVPTAKLPV